MPVNWELGIQRNNALDSFKTGMELGRSFREQEDKRKLRDALQAYAADPSNEAKANAVLALDPSVGLKLRENQRGDQFNSALGDYLMPGGQPNALLGMSGGQRPAASLPLYTTPGIGDQNNRDRAARTNMAGPGVNALASIASPPASNPAMPGQNALAAWTDGAKWPSPVNAPQPQVQPSQPDPMVSLLGKPQSQEDVAFLRMLRADPKRALEIQSGMRDNFVGKLKTEHDLYSLAIDQLSTVNDEASYQAVLQRLAPMVQAVGGDLTQHVPANYPGPEGVRELMLKSMDAKDRIGALISGDRAATYAANVQADNERADRNTDSMIATREERTRIYGDKPKGGGRKKKGKGGKARSMPTATNPATGETVQWNGSAWVPVK